MAMRQDAFFGIQEQLTYAPELGELYTAAIGADFAMTFGEVVMLLKTNPDAEQGHRMLDYLASSGSLPADSFVSLLMIEKLFSFHRDMRGGGLRRLMDTNFLNPTG